MLEESEYGVNSRHWSEKSWQFLGCPGYGNYERFNKGIWESLPSLEAIPNLEKKSKKKLLVPNLV